MSIGTTPWPMIWTAVWSAMSESRANAIESYLADKLEGITQGEIKEAIEKLADRAGEEKYHTAPSVKDIEWQIRNARKAKRGINTDEPYEISQAKRVIRDAPVDSDVRWNTICEAYDAHGAEWAHKLEAWAIRTGGLQIPWFVNARQHHADAKQEPKPEGVRSTYDVFAVAHRKFKD